jgi:hypothetical protein
VNCPRCHNHIAEGFYCIRCGYVPARNEALVRGWSSGAEPSSNSPGWAKFAQPTKFVHDLADAATALSLAK